MKKETILTCLETELTKTMGNYDFAIDWDKRNHTIELIFQLFAQNKVGLAIEDTDGTKSEEEIIEFEDALLFYLPGKSQFEESDYLKVFPYEGKKGIDKALILAISTYLPEVLTEGESDLLDFLNDQDADVFELKWQDAEFDEIYAKKKEKNAGNVAYPSY
ncbi:DUF3013 family protein [Vagococcus entomophilus]|uniref:DUF3013 domain-containing protein n=1 Tax=Vagococcus entomophilus TaxID=1160095 RepID=A0A430AGH6_9ENTE|nr:DUF3013 family protein [Vagococcus entomophilus]RSU07026.1 hypothetical protein CBF30_07145 [Vagococcus entomophilus]